MQRMNVLHAPTYRWTVEEYEELGRAGFTDVTTAKEGVNLPVRVDITLGTTVFTGLTTVQWKATQGKGGAAKSIKTK